MKKRNGRIRKQHSNANDDLNRYSTSMMVKITKREKTRLILPIIIPNTMYRFVKRIKPKSDLPSGFSRQWAKNIHDKETY